MLPWKTRYDQYYSLSSPAESEADDVTALSPTTSKPAWSFSRWLTLCNILVLVANLSTFAYFASQWTHFRSHQTFNELGVPKVPVVFEVNPKLNESRAWGFTGPPSIELDRNWSELLDNANIAVSAEQMIRLGRLDEGVKLGDGSGYLGQLSIYHSLHCVKRIHHFLHRDHYFGDLSERELYLLEAHNVHCLDYIRQSLMCGGDSSVITMLWGETQPVPLANSNAPHQCVSWDALDGWARKRRADVFAPGMVVHPTLGPAYAGANVHLGVVIDHEAS